MVYVSLYRKYRSQTFDDVMGQDHVVRTLQNAIKLGKVAHAYLFCGTRGTGKTTTARLLAKALNCVNGPTPKPCNECEFCRRITEGSAMDITELDAASHRGVDDIAEIRENVKFPPMELRYKVFIIDEVHQLSKDAKDAFLKTLEEPPSHTIFILATTEPQSIPVTIRSRCQQFDFRRGSLKDIRDRLKYVAASEDVKVDDDALDLISVNADGSYRDSLSLMEQVFSYTDGHVTADDVNTVLGTVTQEFIFKITDTIASGDERGIFNSAAEAVEAGRDIQQILRSLSQHFRNLLFASVTSNLGDIVPSEETAARLIEQASKFSKVTLLKAVETFSEAEKDTRFYEQHRLLLELALLKVMELIRQPVQAAKPTAAPDRMPEQRPSAPVRTAETKLSADAQPQAEAEAVKPKHDRKKTAESVPAETMSNLPEQNAGEAQSLPDFDKVNAKWNQVMQVLRTVNVMSHALLSSAELTGVRDGAIVLVFNGEGQQNLFMNETQKGKSITKKQAFQQAVHRVFGVPNVNILCEPRSSTRMVTAAPVESPDVVDDRPHPDLYMDDRDDDNTPIDVADVMDIFPNGKIVD
ncbi:MAG: DNA polymerase III subunit gamma/tau [Armatimonadota bacterium]